MKPYSGSDIHMVDKYDEIFPVQGKKDLLLMESSSNMEKVE